MADKIKPAALGKGQTGLDIKLTTYNIKKPTKRETILHWLINHSNKGSKVTRLDAEFIGDHCLNSTVAEIQQVYSVKISRQKTKRPTRFNKAADFNEYWIAETDLVNAREVLAEVKTRRALS